jgi:regulation of enolase protein 1 (concanavalin A-like superfamily)
METDPRKWQDVDGSASSLWDGDGVLTAGPRTDWFVEPSDGRATASAPLLLTPVAGDFQLSARVRGELVSRYDAGALFVHGNDTTWAKLAMERSPEGADTIVTVVTRAVSDDANSVAVATPGEAWLRISRTGHVYHFHYSADGQRWLLARLFTLGPVDGHRAGLSVQSPLGDGLSVRMDHLSLTATSLADPRDGS